MRKPTLSIIGFGAFGQFMAPHLTPHFQVFAWSRSNYQAEAENLYVNWCSIEEALQKQVIVLSTNISYFETLLKTYCKHINPQATVLDVASVKIKPIDLMLKYLPETCQIIGTHPLFGPQSGKNGIAGLNMVYCPVRVLPHTANCIKSFLADTLQLNVLERTPEQHDREMAYVQGLTHFVARALDKIDALDYPMKTKAYEHLLTVKNMLAGDSWDLFVSIENENPFAEKVRSDFMAKLNELEFELKKKSS